MFRTKLITFLIFCPVIVFTQDTPLVIIPDFTSGVTSRTETLIDPCEKKIKIKYIESNSTGSLTIQSDQDYFFYFPKSKNEDRNYTQGTAIIYSHPKLINSWLFFPHRKLFSLNSNQRPYSSAIGLCGTAFTPRIIDSETPIIGDRPFSFLLSFNTSSTFLNRKTICPNGIIKSRDIYNSFSVNYGIFGTNIGYAFQSFAHKNIVKGRPIDPKGWNTQISKGGSPTILFEYNRFQKILELPKSNKIVDKRTNFDLGWNAGGSIGYYDRVYTGLYTRFGFLRSDNQARWNNSFASLSSLSYQVLSPGEPIKKFKKFINKFEAFGYGKINTTLMFKNAMLMGQSFKSSEYTLKPGWANVGLLELEWGIVIAFEYKRKEKVTPSTAAIQFRTVYRSPEFNSKIFPERWHYFGSFGLMIPL